MGGVMLTAAETAYRARTVAWCRNSAARDLPCSLTEAFSPDAQDEALIKAIACQDKRAMALLHARHSARIYRFVLRMSGDASLADDVVSEVFLEVWRRADGFEARSRASTWLLAIARNKMLSARRHVRDQPLDDRRAAAIPDMADGPEACLDKKDRSDTIRKCISQLSAVQRQVVDLVYFRDKTIEEVAYIVGAPVSTVKTRMFYARRRMERLLAASGVGLH